MQAHNLIDYLQTQLSQAPDAVLDDRKIQAFNSMIISAIDCRPAPMIEYTCEFPKHEFLNYLVERRNLLLHGSNARNIELLKPIRKSWDIRQCGNVSGVYATSDGIWAIFYAIISRENDLGSFINGGFRMKGADSVDRKFYHFAMDIRLVNKQPWKGGAVYLLPRESFVRLQDPSGYALDEWASVQPVAPLAWLPVSPQDFPLLDKVCWRRDNPTSQPAQRGRIEPGLYEKYTGAYELESGFILKVIREYNHLFIQAPGMPAVELCQEYGTLYSLKVVDIQITFVENSRSEVTHMILHLQGQNAPAVKVE
jgi:hypothetical protein